MTSTAFVKVAEPDEIGEGRMKRVQLGSTRMVLANVGGSIHAFGDECTHDGGPLVEGELRACVITCPWHFSRFDITTGAVVESPAEDPIAVYEVMVDGTGVHVGGPVRGGAR
jgi:nitrite reductase/ring-hydroxylating ferredoxin subunit